MKQIIISKTILFSLAALPLVAQAALFTPRTIRFSDIDDPESIREFGGEDVNFRMVAVRMAWCCHHSRDEQHVAAQDASKTPAPLCDKWPDSGFWLSTNSMKPHNKNCENYRTTRGYPCQKDEGCPCGKCGG